ncbi:hypothetical protein GGR57DRAFT_335254 [Xylariaceae sp. FL1272]|nr:hypothetical protein GGR57DRAFT_335254 [Xylariaceae sp. FL1272]
MATQHHKTRRLGLFIVGIIGFVLIWHHQRPSTPDQPARETISILSPPKPPTLDLSSPTAPFISWPLKRLCNEQVQTYLIPGLIFLCDNNSGGPGNIRNYILTCLRYAIEAGATGLQMPMIRTRSSTDRSNIFNEHKPLSYMFSDSHFRDALAEACPHITVFPVSGPAGENAGLDLIPGVTAKAQREGLDPSRMIHRITPKNFGGNRGGCDARDPHKYPSQFGSSFRKWMSDREGELSLQPPSWENPMLVRLAFGTLWDWPIYYDGPEFATTFGGLLRIREDILQLADKIVQTMREHAASTPSDTSGEASVKRPKNAFLGIHLRTEEDALPQWPTYENQSKGYFHEAEKQGFGGGAAYLASGSEEESLRFAADARTHLHLDVMSKYDLVKGRDLKELRAMSWDQQALVDFAVLLEADYFVGVSPSSFSINIALKRHLQQDGVYSRPFKVGSSDGRSWLVGRTGKYWDDWLFMFDGMWP